MFVRRLSERLPLEDALQRYFRQVEAVADSAQAVARARELGTPVLVTGSLYLLNDLAVRPARVA